MHTCTQELHFIAHKFGSAAHPSVLGSKTPPSFSNCSTVLGWRTPV